ncbi:hypothetical protein [Aliiglaciecola litoralis]|uniref:Uncharacterized protein n=1 Tax=Aliiglaciecola litoralis TaxID=582857 RepID=A0ABN1LRD9_9ALTE
MQSKVRIVIDFLAAVISCYVLACLFHSQFVLHELTKLGVEIDLMTRLNMSFEDIIGLLSTYGSAIAVALLIAFVSVKLLSKVLSKRWQSMYPIAGALAILVTLLTMHPILEITLIAGARTPLGVAMQGLAGLFGGWVFLHQRRNAAK